MRNIIGPTTSLFLSMMLLVFVSCKKENNNQNAPSPGFAQKTMIRFIDKTNGSPLQDINVSLVELTGMFPEPGYKVLEKNTTDKDGIMWFNRVPEGSYTFRAAPNGFLPATFTLKGFKQDNNIEDDGPYSGIYTSCKASVSPGGDTEFLVDLVRSTPAQITLRQVQPMPDNGLVEGTLLNLKLECRDNNGKFILSKRIMMSEDITSSDFGYDEMLTSLFLPENIETKFTVSLGIPIYNSWNYAEKILHTEDKTIQPGIKNEIVINF